MSEGAEARLYTKLQEFVKFKYGLPKKKFCPRLRQEYLSIRTMTQVVMAVTETLGNLPATVDLEHESHFDKRQCRRNGELSECAQDFRAGQVGSYAADNGSHD